MKYNTHHILKLIERVSAAYPGHVSHRTVGWCATSVDWYGRPLEAVLIEVDGEKETRVYILPVGVLPAAFKKRYEQRTCPPTSDEN